MDAAAWLSFASFWPLIIFILILVDFTEQPRCELLDVVGRTNIHIFHVPFGLLPVGDETRSSFQFASGLEENKI